MHRFASLSALALALAAFGCGGKQFELGDASDDAGATDGGGSDASDGGGGGDASDGGVKLCTLLPGCIGTPTRCQLDCNTCYCDDGQWSCTAVACLDASTTCPATMPATGSYCAQNGEQCSYATGRCGPSCTCEQNQWRCVYPPCPPPPPCPSTPPTGGGSCTAWEGEQCNYPQGCGGVFCSCPNVASPTWQCMIGDCIDAGH